MAGFSVDECRNGKVETGLEPGGESPANDVTMISSTAWFGRPGNVNVGLGGLIGDECEAIDVGEGPKVCDPGRPVDLGKLVKSGVGVVGFEVSTLRGDVDDVEH